MPSATPFEPSMLPPGRKRRRDDDGEVQVQFAKTTQCYHNESPNLLSTINNNERLKLPSSARAYFSSLNIPRKAVLPASKRSRLLDENEEQHAYSHPLSSHAGHHLHQHQQSPFPHAHPEYSTPPASPDRTRCETTTRANQPLLLSPCHICHRKPTKKSELDSFADCMGCGRRACFICIRACQGWLPPVTVVEHSASSDEEAENPSASFTMRDVDDDGDNHGYSQNHEPSQKQGRGDGWVGRGHREVICSRCCVERGLEGDVVCLGCLIGMSEA
ncbi:hypothetical protein GGS23DRAFT_572846 [Durotheca rogersii]|uniref:uncharacterized protein n=1 Tax=Durotheca rogersii TaxID=419775 RepID=UPI00221E685F|nr:uncharacterized protein GGS23DRAFT_572846 [Durotheca rogersii]KAI5862138.1 hypothetical protein GGS23DRAFT_572846 [Durotheca rogersii]